MDIKLKAWCDVGYDRDLRDNTLMYINSHCQIRSLQGKPIDTKLPYARYLALFDGGGVNAFGAFPFKKLMNVSNNSLELSVDDFKTLCCMTHGTWETQTYLTQVGVAPRIKTVDDLMADITDEPMGTTPSSIVTPPPTPPDGDKPMEGQSFSFSRGVFKTSCFEEEFQHLKFEKYSDLKEFIFNNISGVIDSLNSDRHLYDFAIESRTKRLEEIHAAVLLFEPEESSSTPVGSTKDYTKRKFTKDGCLHEIIAEVKDGFIVCNITKQFRFFMRKDEFEKLVSDEKPVAFKVKADDVVGTNSYFIKKMKEGLKKLDEKQLDSKWQNVRKLEEEFKDSSCSESSLNCGEIVVPFNKMYDVNDDLLSEHMKIYEASNIHVGDAVYSKEIGRGEIKKWEVHKNTVWFKVEFDCGEFKWYYDSEFKDCCNKWEVQ